MGRGRQSNGINCVLNASLIALITELEEQMYHEIYHGSPREFVNCQKYTPARSIPIPQAESKNLEFDVNIR